MTSPGRQFRRRLDRAAAKQAANALLEARAAGLIDAGDVAMLLPDLGRAAPGPQRLDTTLTPATATHFTASDVPRARDRLVEHWSHSLETVLNMHPDTLHFPFHLDRRDRFGFPAPWTVQEYVARIQGWMAEAELFYVTPDMSAVVKQAAEAMPTYEVHQDALPARVGFVVFGDTVCVVNDQCPGMFPGERCEIKAMLWAPVEETSDGPGLILVTIQDTGVMVSTRPALSAVPDVIRSRTISSPLAYHEEYPLPFGNRPWGEQGPRQVRNSAVAAAMSTWIMMGQRITETTTERAPRALRRQYERAGRPEPTVRTVTLRRASKPRQERQPGEESSRTYRHQWVVGEYGYWRNTWYPSKEEHRLQFVYVPAYVKGPEGAPMIGGERVNVLRR